MSSGIDLKYHRQLERIQEHDIQVVVFKDKTYGASWKKRGGVGAFMMLARKWDRLEEMVQTVKFDIFEGIKRDVQSGDVSPGDDGTFLAEIRDLRRYLLLVEAYMVEQGHTELDIEPKELVQRRVPRYPEPNRPGTPDDGGHHAER